MKVLQSAELNYTQINLDVMNTLVKAIEAKDPYTGGHVWRVSQYAKRIAEKLGWEKERIAWIEAGAMLHDLGKIGVGDLILQKDGILTDEEFREMKKHPSIGVHLIETSLFMSQYKHCILSHHERYDGAGYPQGLQGENIPIEGRIIAVADTFDALTSHRPYRRARSSEDAIYVIQEQSGTQFDPEVAQLFIKLWWESHFKDIILHSAAGIPLVRCPEHGEIIERHAQVAPGDHAYCPACKANFRLEENDGEWIVAIG